MSSPVVWSFMLAAATIFGLYVAEKKLWWVWMVQILTQCLWLAYALGTRQWGFLLLAVVHGALGFRDGFRWRNANRRRIPDTTIRFPPKERPDA